MKEEPGRSGVAVPLEDESHLPTAEVEVYGNQLIIKNFVCEDDEISSYFKQLKQEARSGALLSAVRLGIIALRTVQVGRDLDYVKSEFENLDTKFKTALDGTLKEIQQKYEEVFGERGDFTRILEKQFGEDGTLLKEVFDPMRDGSPLFKLRNELVNQIQQLKQQLGISEREKELREGTTLKGYDFETECLSALSSIAKDNGDVIEDISELIGEIPRSKKGDLVLKLPNGKRIVWELKGGAESFSARTIFASLDEAIKNRDASFGIFVARYVESVPSQGWFNEFGNKLVVALSSRKEEEEQQQQHPHVGSSDDLRKEMLLIAYKWAKAKVLAESYKKVELDSSFVSEKMSLVKEKIEKIELVKSKCSSAMTAIKEAREMCGELKQDLVEILDSVLAKLASAP
jgi:hypothetical protein